MREKHICVAHECMCVCVYVYVPDYLHVGISRCTTFNTYRTCIKHCTSALDSELSCACGGLAHAMDLCAKHHAIRNRVRRKHKKTLYAGAPLIKRQIHYLIELIVRALFTMYSYLSLMLFYQETDNINISYKHNKHTHNTHGARAQVAVISIHTLCRRWWWWCMLLVLLKSRWLACTTIL